MALCHYLKSLLLVNLTASVTVSMVSQSLYFSLSLSLSPSFTFPSFSPTSFLQSLCLSIPLWFPYGDLSVRSVPFKLMDSCAVSLEMLSSKQQLMKYAAGFCLCSHPCPTQPYLALPSPGDS